MDSESGHGGVMNTPDAAPPKETLELCKQALASLEARKGEDIDAWAEKLARAVVPVPKGDPGVVEHHISCRHPTIAEIGCKLCIACGHAVIRGNQYLHPPVEQADAPGGPWEELRDALLAHENKVVDMTLACGEKLDHVYHMTAIVRKSREALLALAAIAVRDALNSLEGDET